MHYVDRAGYAMREFYARNPRLAPRATSPRRRAAVVCTFLFLLGVGAAGGALLTSTQFNPMQVIHAIEQAIR
jgi:hypothetical protein